MGSTKKSDLVDVLSQTAEAAQQVKSASTELEVVHAVLSTQVPSQDVHGDVQAAVERTDEIGQQLAETAEALEKTTEKLREIEAGRV